MKKIVLLFLLGVIGFSSNAYANRFAVFPSNHKNDDDYCIGINFHGKFLLDYVGKYGRGYFRFILLSEDKQQVKKTLNDLVYNIIVAGHQDIISKSFRGGFIEDCEIKIHADKVDKIIIHNL